MPATDLGWQRTQSPPIFQVFGTKRKNDGQDQICGFDPKRRCTQAESMEEEPVVSMVTQPVQPSGDNRAESSCELSLLDMQASQRQILERVPPLHHHNLPQQYHPNITPAQEQNNNNHMVPQLQDQNNLFMDLESEVYTTATLPLNPQTDAEYEAACNMMAAMEGEGAPDPQQYRVTPTVTSGGDGGVQQTPVAYCDQYCVGGDHSPSSGRVRCFCKPSWEGMTDMRPYISDYY